jgi:rhomboid family GlyGly-CTERM serine protease
MLATPAFVAALVGAALLLLQAIAPAAALLEYRRLLLPAEPWRVLTGHLVHVSWQHAIANAAAWIVLAYLFEPVVDAKRQLVCLMAGAAAISIALALAWPSIAWYRGASGMLHALFFAGATASLSASWRTRQRWPLLWAALLLAGGAVKVVLEYPHGGGLPYAQWLGSPVVPQAHLIGAIVGCAVGLLFGRGGVDSTRQTSAHQ